MARRSFGNVWPGFQSLIADFLDCRLKFGLAVAAALLPSRHAGSLARPYIERTGN